MQIERIGIRLRRRSQTEALDLGHGMFRAWAKPAYRAWFASYWLIGLPLLLLLWPWQGIAPLIIWWLKPVADRALLFAYSRSLFGTDTRIADIVRALPGLLKSPGMLSALTLRRFSLVRSYLLPVWQLEQQRGAAARARFRLLSRRHRGTAAWLTFVCANLVTVLGISLILLIEFLAPIGSEGLFDADEWLTSAVPPWKLLLINLCFMVAESLIEPLYVASGFSLYLNRRSELEGWDIELAFRRLANRHAATFMAGLATVVMLFMAQPMPLHAADAATHTSVARRTVDQVLADPAFGHEEERLEWQRRDDSADEIENDWLEPYLKFIDFLGEVMRGFVWIGVILVAALVIYLALRYREKWWHGDTRQPPPESLFGLDLRPVSLPSDIVAEARRAAAAGRILEALSLLYRGALVDLIHHQQAEFRAGDTEGDCLQRARRHLPADAWHYFAELLDAWRATAYAHIPPTPERVERLCADWAGHFGSEPTQRIAS